MRVTDSARFDLLRRELYRTTSEVARHSERLATGRAVNRWSDEPELAVQADRLKAEDDALTAYSDAAENARAWLTAQDGALQAGVNAMKRVRELAISAGSALGPSAREGIAVELDGIRSQLIDVANTSFHGRAIFAGFGTAAVTETGGTVAFVGDDGAVQRRVGHDRIVRVNVSGASAFGFADGDDVFGVIADLAAHVRAGDSTAISGSDLARVVTATERLTGALGNVGSQTNQVTAAMSLNIARGDEIRAYRSSIVDADLAESALELTLAETAYNAVLAATARLQRPSLVDYLR